MKSQYVNELKSGQSVKEKFVLSKKIIKDKKDGGYYAILEFSDRTGSIDGISWSGEDLNSIITGIVQQKGRIHLAAGSQIIINKNNGLAEYQVLNKVVDEIDKQIIRNYRLWPNNYIAYDILNGLSKYSEYYSDEQKASFISYVRNYFQESNEEVKRILLAIYANPVKRIESLKENR